jgi:mRNA interferase RelE/StbE
LAWSVEVSPSAARQLQKQDRSTASRITKDLAGLVADCSDPRQRGKGLTANLSGLWRYRVGDFRVGDFRVLCRLEDQRLVVLVVAVAHRGDAHD